MQRDPKKRITDVGIGIHQGEVKAILLVNHDAPLVIESRGLNPEQAELLLEGCVDGLRGSEQLPRRILTTFLSDPAAIAALEVPLDISPADRELFKRGAIGGLGLAADGYWLDVAEPAQGRTLH
jgi:hypothetical protein